MALERLLWQVLPGRLLVLFERLPRLRPRQTAELVERVDHRLVVLGRSLLEQQRRLGLLVSYSRNGVIRPSMALCFSSQAACSIRPARADPATRSRLASSSASDPLKSSASLVTRSRSSSLTASK